jgi:hypothetical protein
MTNIGIIVKCLGLKIKQQPIGTFLHQINNYTINTLTKRSKTSTRHKNIKSRPNSLLELGGKI